MPSFSRCVSGPSLLLFVHRPYHFVGVSALVFRKKKQRTRNVLMNVVEKRTHHSLSRSAGVATPATGGVRTRRRRTRLAARVLRSIHKPTPVTEPLPKPYSSTHTHNNSPPSPSPPPHAAPAPTYSHTGCIIRVYVASAARTRFDFFLGKTLRLKRKCGTPSPPPSDGVLEDVKPTSTREKLMRRSPSPFRLIF